MRKRSDSMTAEDLDRLIEEIITDALKLEGQELWTPEGSGTMDTRGALLGRDRRSDRGVGQAHHRSRSEAVV